MCLSFSKGHLASTSKHSESAIGQDSTITTCTIMTRRDSAILSTSRLATRESREVASGHQRTCPKPYPLARASEQDSIMDFGHNRTCFNLCEICAVKLDVIIIQEVL